MSNTTVCYRSTDASAPALSGSAGSLVALLDACLVNGYGTQAAAGWTIAYTATNKRAYRNSSSLGTGFYLSVDDSGPGGGSYREARMTGFQTMSAIATGTGQFPSGAQLAIGSGSVVCRKSTSSDSTARAWTLIADPTCFYLFTESADYTSPTAASMFMFGDFFSYAPSDAYNCMIMGRVQENYGSSGAEWSVFGNGFYSQTFANVLAMTLPGHFIAANQTGVGNSILCGKHIDFTKSGFCGTPSYSGTSNSSNNGGLVPIGGYEAGLNAMVYPNPQDNGLYLSPVWIHHGGTLRGYMKGLWAPVQSIPLNHNDPFSGSGGMSGKSFVAQWIPATKNNNSAFAPGEFIIETSSTWS